VHTLWFAAHLFNREPICTAALALATTSRVKVALIALSPYTVHPVYAAMAAATLDEWFPGRVKPCLGVGAPRDLEAAGVAAPQPLATLRESLAVARALLAGESVAYAGERFQVHGRRLATGARAVPLLLAASGPRMLTLAAAAADGVVISAAAAPAFVAWTLDRVRQSGRAVRHVALVYAAMDERPERAHTRLRRELGFILRGAHHARNLRLAGSTLEQAALADAYAREDWLGVEALVGDDLVRRHAASGTPADVRMALEAYEAAGLDEIVLSGLAGQANRAAILRVAMQAGAAQAGSY